MGQLAYGTITITDITDISNLYLQYGLAVQNANVTNEYPFNQTGEVGWSTTYPTWTSGYQIWVREVREYGGVAQLEYGTPYLDTAVNQLNTRIGSSETNITALQTKLKRIWINENTHGDYVAGTYAASGINGITFDESNPQTYGYNTLLRHNALDLRYNTVQMTSLTTAALTFYIPTQSNNQWVRGNKGLELTAEGLKLFQFQSESTENPTIAAELNSNGLTLSKGGISVGRYNASATDANQDFVYISNTDYGSTISTLHDTKTDWRALIGNKFGVDKAGNLYASNANISGTINATEGTIGGWTINDSYGIYTNSKTTATSDKTGVLIQKDGAIYAGAYDSTAEACPFQVNSNGVLNATEATIKGALTATSLSTGTKTAQNTGTGVFIDGEGNIYAGSGSTNNFEVTSAGALTAKSGTIGGWSFTDAALYYNNATPGYSTTNLVISKNSAVNTNAIAGSATNKHWFLAAGRNFGVDTSGILYANGATIKGEIQADTGYIASSITIGSGGTSLSTIESNVSTALAGSIEYIVGTHGSTATNAWTGVTRDSSLVTGKTIAFYMTSAGTSTAATLNLTLAGGGTTGAKNIRINNSNVTTHYPQYSVVKMTYDGTYWKVDNYNSDTYNRTRYQAVLTAAEAITAAHIICGNTSGYRNIAANVAFDMTYPLLYAGTTIVKGATDGTRDNNYLEINNIAYTSNGTVTSGAAAKTIFLKGTITGNTFTIAASPFMTTVVPTSEDGYCYIPLGIMTSTTNGYFKSSSELWAYKDGAFGPVSIREASAAAKVATNYIYASSSGIRIASANPSSQNQRLELTSSDAKFYDSGGVQRVGINATNGVIIGRTNKGRTVVTDAGLQIYDTNNKKRAEVNSGGLNVYDTDGSTSIALFSESIRLGIIDKLEITNTSLIYTSNYNTTFSVERPSNGTTVTKTTSGALKANEYTEHIFPESTSALRVIAGTSANPSGTQVSMTIPAEGQTTTITNNNVEFKLIYYYGRYKLFITNNASAQRTYKVTYSYLDDGVTVKVNDARLNIQQEDINGMSISQTTGLIQTCGIVIYGHVGTINMRLQTTASTPAGSNVFEGTIYKYLPIGGCRLAGLYGSTPLIGWINDDGTVAVRNCGNSALSVTGNSFITVSGTYIFNDSIW